MQNPVSSSSRRSRIFPGNNNSTKKVVTVRPSIGLCIHITQTIENGCTYANIHSHYNIYINRIHIVCTSMGKNIEQYVILPPLYAKARCTSTHFTCSHNYNTYAIHIHIEWQRRCEYGSRNGIRRMEKGVSRHVEELSTL